jgi:hypothetical protein
MSKGLIYDIGGKKMSRIEAVEYYAEKAKNYSEPTRSFMLNTIYNEFKNDQQMENTKNKFQTIWSPIIGIAMLMLILYITIFTPYPSQYQATIFWLILALSMSISSVLIAGSLEYTNKIGIKAVGGFAIFCIMFFLVPKIYEKTGNEQTNKLTVFLITSDSKDIKKLDVDFDRNSSRKMADQSNKSLIAYLGSEITPLQFTCYRKSDGKIYTNESCSDVKEFEVLMICEQVSQKYSNKLQAFLHFKQIVDSISSK